MRDEFLDPHRLGLGIYSTPVDPTFFPFTMGLDSRRDVDWCTQVAVSFFEDVVKPMGVTIKSYMTEDGEICMLSAFIKTSHQQEVRHIWRAFLKHGV